MSQQKITDDLDALLGIIPPEIAASITEVNDSANLLEVIFDLGRIPDSALFDG